MALVQFDAPPLDPAADTLEMSAERDARLLVTGDYPDKGLTITEADLDTIVARFSENAASVKVEHGDSPLDPLGVVRRLWREGNTLFARLAFPEDLAAFLKRRGILKLSVGLSKDPLTLREVSLVTKPRVASAALLSQSGDPRDIEIVRLRRELQDRVVSGQLARLKTEGRLTPVTEPLARALLAAGEDGPLITLSQDGQAETVADIFLRFLQAQPPLIRFGELAPAGPGQPGSVFSPEDETFLRDRLGVSPEKVAAYLDTRKENES